MFCLKGLQFNNALDDMFDQIGLRLGIGQFYLDTIITFTKAKACNDRYEINHKSFINNQMCCR